MKIYNTALKEVKVIEYDKRADNRGYSYSLYSREELKKAELDFQYVEERAYTSLKAGTLYGIHFQNQPKAQTKIIYCLKGKGLDYAVDLRKDSPTFKQWVCIPMSADNRKQLYIPKGFGHAFLSLVDDTVNVMAYDEPFDPQFSRQIAYNDPELHIDFPIKDIILAPHDVNAPWLKDCDLNL